MLENSGIGQTMIIPRKFTVRVKPDVDLEITIETFCLDSHRANLSSIESLTVLIELDEYVIELMKLVDQYSSSFNH